MGKVFEQIDDSIRQWVEAQKIFFVATAPLSADGLVNCSPKGMDTFRILDERTLAYLDYTGSGIETVAHLRENGRIVIMMCSFDRSPRIMRFHGRGRVAELGTPRFDELASRFEVSVGARAIIEVELSRISDSCGYSVPIMEFREERDTLRQWSEKKGEAAIKAYQEKSNRQSLDGLPGL